MQIIKEQALNKVNSGWHNLVEQVFEIEKQLPFCSGIADIGRKNGMLQVRFVYADTLNEYQRFILSSLEYRFERISAKICEKCGKYGFGRKDLKEVLTLCFTCYVLEYDTIADFVPPLVAN